MRIALYFGSFNPIHNGHLGLADFLIQEKITDAVWFVLSPQNPLKNSNQLLNDSIRLEMTRLAVHDNKEFSVCDIEFSMPKPNYTIFTLRELKKRYPEHQFSLLIGADNMEICNQWKEFQSILDEFHVMVYPREGYDFAKPKYPEMQLISAPLFNVSSTEVRDNIKWHKSFGNLVPKAVADDIKEHELFL